MPRSLIFRLKNSVFPLIFFLGGKGTKVGGLFPLFFCFLRGGKVVMQKLFDWEICLFFCNVFISFRVFCWTCIMLMECVCWRIVS